MRGLGFRDLRLFNLAPLGKQICRLLTSKDTLCYHVLSSKYFPNNDLFHPKVVDRPSYTRTSIIVATKALENDFGWQVGDRNNIDIRKDNWGFEGLNSESLSSTILTSHERKIKDVMLVLDKKAIADFITMLSNSWNNRNNYVFWGEEEEARVVWDRAKTLYQDFRSTI
ncbi:hypothetical protein J1N35_028880 [Gossypium stocksii]|uniref:Uncharacterized protein n=1 Tax=Gossypium stocksii TaxID=47602 RepID=A0A9D3ZSP1_9ROSI|nr:hypothetical protein J1N35_028880 [Gossypium stocksii]